jgi:hypothetical protein
MREAMRALTKARTDPTHPIPANPTPPPEVREAIKELPPGTSPVVLDPFHGLPPPPLFHNTSEMDLRLSRSALRAARAVLVVVPRASLAAYGGAAAPGGAVEVGVGVDGAAAAATATATAAATAAAVGGTDAATAAALPPLFLEDLGRLIGGRRSVRLYIADE